MNTRCILIGEDSLLIQCGNQLIANNYNVCLVISPIKSIQQWAETQAIPVIKSITDFEPSNFIEIDYIFSIVNSHVLSPPLIKLARKAAINYHDSLLPDYAGLNATSWALLNGEKQHGVTWHLMSEKIDEGHILVQHSFPIEENDTALTLNLRCYEQAITSFNELIVKLKSGCYSAKPQILTNRHYFSTTHLLPDLGFINWKTMSAQLILRMHRALVLGHYKNNIGRIKIYLESDFLIVTDAHIMDIQCKEKTPGTILNVSLDELQVVTCNGVINLRVKTSTMENIVSDTISKYHLLPGLQLPFLPSNLLELHSKCYRHALKHESFWIKKFNNTAEHKTFSSIANCPEHFEQAAKFLTISQILANKSDEEKTIILLTGLLIYFFRLNNYEKCSAFLVPKIKSVSQEKLPSLFPSFLPLTWPSMKAVYTLKDMMKQVEKKHTTLLAREGYLGDILSRHPEIENHISPSILISFSPIESIRIPKSVTVCIYIDEKKDSLRCYHRLSNNDQNNSILQLISYFNNHISNIINQLCIDPNVLINSFSFLGTAEEDILMKIGQGEFYPLPTESITSLFEKNVEYRPHHPAILIGNEIVTYVQLWQLAEVIANTIQTNALPKAFIGIYAKRCPLMLAMILGVLKADCIYVPLDPKHPLGKIDLIATNAELTLILTTSIFFDNLANYFKIKNAVSIINAEILLHNSSQTKKFETSPIYHNENRLAYIMFTSGTTGEPKGVVISQRNVINYCCWFNQTTKFDSKSTIDFSSSIAFDLSVPCTIAPLIAGGTIAICSEEEKINPQMYLEHIQRFKVTHTELTPGYLELLLSYPEKIRQLDNLKYLMLGADVVHTNEVEAWLNLSPKTQIINEYGPTEATVSVTSYFVEPNKILKTSSIPIGKPAFNSYCYVLDKYNNLCPIGMKGELHIGGEQVALGYLAKPQTTAEKFITLSFNNRESIRLYKTGDEVNWILDGQLQFFGRNDSQVKIYGYRVELTAIETFLMQYQAIHQAVVVAIGKNYKEKYLCAYLVTNKTTISLNDLKNFLANYLPSYMIPKEFYLVDNIPLKENEKIDFERLEHEIQKELLSSQKILQDELTTTQHTCLTIWQSVFNKQSLRLEDNFFDLGGDSLIALQIITSLKNHYSIPLSLSCLFECPTIISLSEKIDLLLNNNSTSHQNLDYKNTLIKLSTGSFPIPIFLVHPVGGSIFWYQQLAKQLDGKYTIYGIQDPNIEEEHYFQSIQDMAAFYIQAISTVYRGDQFYLGGSSFGATVAFEMAYQIEQTGLKISFLGLLDGWAHYPPSLMQEGSLSLISYNKKYLTNEKRNHLLAQEKHRQQLLYSYSIPILTTNVSLFKAKTLWDDFKKINDPYNGWQKHIHGEITVHLVPGTHESMFFHPNIEKWGHLMFEKELENSNKSVDVTPLLDKSNIGQNNPKFICPQCETGSLIKCKKSKKNSVWVCNESFCHVSFADLKGKPNLNKLA